MPPKKEEITLHVLPRGKPIKRLPEEIEVRRSEPTTELYKQLAKATGMSVHQLRVTKSSDNQPVPNDINVSIDSTGLGRGSRINVKDLGTQVSWTVVFLIEYLGPILIHPAMYLLRPYLYSNPASPKSSVIPSRFTKPTPFPAPSDIQTVTMALFLIHYIKRELETLFIHRFSSATMPIFNIFKNSSHYWLLSGVFVGYFIYAPTGPSAGPVIPALTFPGLALFLIGELGNFQSHLVLAGLRSKGGKERGIPTGAAFDLVTCPNYMFETIAWIGVALVSRNWSLGVFLAVSVGQMLIWAKKKERRYRSEFGDKYKNKKFTMLPGIA